MSLFNIGLIDIIRAKKAQGTLDDIETDASRFCEYLREGCEDPEKLAPYTHALTCIGWGGRSRCRNLLFQLLFGSRGRDRWIVLFGETGIGVFDHNREFHEYEADAIKKIGANATDGSMVRVYFKGERYLELRFGEFFAGQHPAKLLKRILLNK